MHNLVKLVQASGKALVVPAAAISSGIVRSLSEREREDNPKAASFVWLILDGMAMSALVRERMGFILNKAGGNSTDREVVEGVDGERISMLRGSFSYAIESQRITDARGKVVQPKDAAVLEKRGEQLNRHDATALKTNLRTAGGGVVDFFVKAGASDIFDLFNADASEDDGTEEYGEDGEPVAPGPAKPTAKKRAKADT